MAAEFGEQLLHLAESSEHMVRFDGPAGALDTVLGFRDDKRRLIVPLPETSGNDTGQGLVTVRQIDYQNLIVLEILLYLLRRLLGE